MSFLSKIGNAKLMLNEIYSSSDCAVELTGERLREFQLFLLSMYKDIVEACERLGIRCFVVGGTCLGAIRHNGFIPWDDDLDISMTRDEYNIFRDHFEELLGEKYILNAPNYSESVIGRFPKVLAKNSKRIPVSGEESELSKVYVDIFILDNIPGNYAHRRIRGFIVNSMEFIAGQVSLYKNRNEMLHASFKSGGKIQYYIRELVGFVFSYRSCEDWCRKIDTAIQYKGDSKNLVGLPTGRKHYLGEIFEESAFFPLEDATFEGVPVKVPCNSDAYLKNLYNDYMQLPPPEKREHHYFTELVF